MRVKVEDRLHECRELFVTNLDLYLLYMEGCCGINFFTSRRHILNTAYTFSHGITNLNNEHSFCLPFTLEPYCRPFVNHTVVILLYLITQKRVNTVEAHLC